MVYLDWKLKVIKMVDDTSIIEMHDTWLTVNSIVGCTNGCKYCFLQATGDNKARPRIKADAAKAISCLFSSKYYTTSIPICLLPNTDPFLNDAHKLTVIDDFGYLVAPLDDYYKAGEESAYIIRGKAWVNNHAHLVKVKDSCDIKYLYYYLKISY